MSSPNNPLAGIDNPEEQNIGDQIVASFRRQPPPVSPSAESTLGPLYQSRAEKSLPTDATRDEYKMGIGGRIMGTLANFLSGMGGRDPMVYTGPGATNNRYAQAEHKRLGELNALNNQISDAANLNEMNRKEYMLASQRADREAQRADNEAQRDAQQEMMDPDSVYLDNTTGKWKGKTFGGEIRETVPPRWFQQLQAKETMQTQRVKSTGQARADLADEYELKGKERRSYILTGKLPDDEYKAKQLQIREAELGLKRDEFKARQKPTISK